MQKAVTDYNGLMQDGTGTIQTGNVLMDNKTGAVYGFIGGLDFHKVKSIMPLILNARLGHQLNQSWLMVQPSIWD